MTFIKKIIKQKNTVITVFFFIILVENKLKESLKNKFMNTKPQVILLMIPLFLSITYAMYIYIDEPSFERNLTLTLTLLIAFMVFIGILKLTEKLKFITALIALYSVLVFILMSNNREYFENIHLYNIAKSKFNMTMLKNYNEEKILVYSGSKYMFEKGIDKYGFNVMRKSNNCKEFERKDFAEKYLDSLINSKYESLKIHRKKKFKVQ